MESISNPEVQEIMRNPPTAPVERIDASISTSANYRTHCRVYHTPRLLTPSISHPGFPPMPPIRPRVLPRKKKGDTFESRKSLKTYYNTKLREAEAIWELNYHEYTKSLDLNKFFNENPEKDEKEDGDEADPFAAVQPLAVFTHGRNSKLDNANITAFCQGFGREASILLFEDLRPEVKRIHVFRTLVDRYESIKAFSGRSAGARNACRASIHAPIKRLIFLTYPLVRDLDYRYADLLALPSDVEVLFVLGDGDPLAVETHLREVRDRMRAKSWWIKMIGGNHSFNTWTPEQTGNTLDIAGQLAALWGKGETLDPELTEMRLQTSHDTGKAEWTAWQAPEPESPQQPTHFKVQVAGGKLPNGGGSFQFTLPGSGPQEKFAQGYEGKQPR